MSKQGQQARVSHSDDQPMDPDVKSRNSTTKDNIVNVDTNLFCIDMFPASNSCMH